MSQRPSAANPAVANALGTHPQPVHDALLGLRSLILETAAATPAVGALVETLKWGQPAYLPKRPRVGTTLRIHAVKGVPGTYALFFHCQSRLGEIFRELYGDTLTIVDDRSIILDVGNEPPREVLRHCIALALTYHVNKRGTA
jgi:hypothetical protein